MVFREYFSFVFYLIQARSDVAARSSGCTNKLDEKSWADQITNKISREKRTNFQQRGRRMPQQQPEKHHHISSLDNLKNNNRKKNHIAFCHLLYYVPFVPQPPCIIQHKRGKCDCVTDMPWHNAHCTACHKIMALQINVVVICVLWTLWILFPDTNLVSDWCRRLQINRQTTTKLLHALLCTC